MTTNAGRSRAASEGLLYSHGGRREMQERGSSWFCGQPSEAGEGYLVMVEGTPRIGAQWLASPGRLHMGKHK